MNDINKKLEHCGKRNYLKTVYKAEGLDLEKIKTASIKEIEQLYDIITSDICPIDY